MSCAARNWSKPVQYPAAGSSSLMSPSSPIIRISHRAANRHISRDAHLTSPKPVTDDGDTATDDLPPG
ncbi:hypothetical protein GCM10009677_43130 [Sphaerisporangium rubeum]